MVSLLKLLIGLCLLSVAARKQHGNAKFKHAHTYLKICANSTQSYGYGCIHKVSAVWPQPARMDPPDCESVGDAEPPPECANAMQAGNSETLINIYEPITIRQGLQKGSFTKGADVDTFTDWDRIACRDGELFSTGWYMKYTPHACARLCAKIKNFYGKSCTHFSRQWISSDKHVHDDSYGRDGDPIPKGTSTQGEHASAGTGTGKYKYRGQCLFFSSPNKDCCATKAYWRENGADTDSNYCTSKYGDRKDGWNNKHRSWRHKFGGGAFIPDAAWPVTSLGRRLSSEQISNVSGEEPFVHHFTLPNGSAFWAVEELYTDAAVGDDLLVEAERTAPDGADAKATSYHFSAWLSSAAALFQSLWATLRLPIDSGLRSVA